MLNNMYSGSAMVDLKAELSRTEKQLVAPKPPGIGQKGSQTFAKIKLMTGKKKKKKHQKDVAEPEPSHQKEVDDETLQLLEKSRHKLEAKSKIYEKMRTGKMEDYENVFGETKFLVDFQKKALDSDDVTELPSTSSIYEADEEYRDNLHAKWDEEQKELLEGPIHYENIKFDEVRDLGTGYFAFSKNEEERVKQMEELQKIRDDTKSKQKRKEELTLKRKAALQERLDKIKKKKLAAGGKDDSLATDADFELPLIKDIKEKEKEKEKEEEQDRISDFIKECRKGTEKEREWDKGKNTTYVAQPFVRPKQKTQDSYIRERRDERPDEFAPPGLYY